EGEAEGQQQAVEGVAAIDAADQGFLDCESDDRGKEGRSDQRAPESQIGLERVGDIAADDQKAAMRKVDDVREIEDERQAQRHQHIEGANDQAIDDVKQEKLGHPRMQRMAPAFPSLVNREEGLGGGVTQLPASGWPL